jgi:hypothetical protein
MEWQLDPVNGLSALASFLSAVFAWKTYRSTVDLKKHDFCLQLRTANSTLRATVNELPELVAYADRSRQAINAAEGMRRSGAAEKWKTRVGEAKTEIEALQARLPLEEKFEAKPLEELTRLIAATHELQTRATALKTEFEAEVQGDDQRRLQRREDMRVTTAARLASPDGRNPQHR